MLGIPKRLKKSGVKLFIIIWKDGLRETVAGKTFKEAFDNAGYEKSHYKKVEKYEVYND